MNDAFEIHESDIRRCKNSADFQFWLETVDDCIDLENIDELINLLILMELPEYTMVALDFKNKYL